MLGALPLSPNAQVALAYSNEGLRQRPIIARIAAYPLRPHYKPAFA